MPDGTSPWFFVFEGALVIGAVVFYLWLRRRSNEMQATFDRRSAEIEQEYASRADPLYVRIAYSEEKSRYHLDEANETTVTQFAEIHLLKSIAWAHQADIARAQLEEI